MGFMQQSTRLPFMYGVIVCTVTIGTLFVSSSIDRNTRYARIYDRSAAQKGARKLMETDFISDEAINVLEHYPLRNDYYYDYADFTSSEDIARLENLVRFGQSSYIYESSLPLSEMGLQVANNGLLTPEVNAEHQSVDQKIEKQQPSDVKETQETNHQTSENKPMKMYNQQVEKDQQQNHPEVESQLISDKKIVLLEKPQTEIRQRELENVQSVQAEQQVSANQQQIQENARKPTNNIARKESQFTDQKRTIEDQQQNIIQQNQEGQPMNNQKKLVNQTKNENPQKPDNLQQNNNDNSATSSDQRQILNQKQTESQLLQTENKGHNPFRQTPEKQTQSEVKEQIPTNQQTNANVEQTGSQQHNQQKGNGNESEYQTRQETNPGQRQNTSNPQLDNKSIIPKGKSQSSIQQLIESKSKDATVQIPVHPLASEQQVTNRNPQEIVQKQEGDKQPRLSDIQPQKQSSEDYPKDNKLTISHQQQITDKEQTTGNQPQNPKQQVLADRHLQSEDPLERAKQPEMAISQKTNYLKLSETRNKQSVVKQPQLPNKQEVNVQPQKQFSENQPKTEQLQVLTQQIIDQKQTPEKQPPSENQKGVVGYQQQSNDPSLRVKQPVEAMQQTQQSQLPGNQQQSNPQITEPEILPSNLKIDHQEEQTDNRGEYINQQDGGSQARSPKEAATNQIEIKQNKLLVSTKEKLKGKENQTLPRTQVEQGKNINRNDSSTEKSDICSSVSFAPSGSLPLIGLVSFPGSGNTWTRLLIEHATGIYTGSVYNDYTLYKGGFLGEKESVGSGTTIVTKTHLFQRSKHYNFTKVILVIRNPFDAILSEYNRKNGPKGVNKSHISFADPEVFQSPNFSKFATGAAYRWLGLIVTLLKDYKRSDRLLVYYETLKDDVITPLERMVTFLRRPIDPDRLQCTKRHADNPKFHRPHKSLGFDPFTEKVTNIINVNIQTARKLIQKYHLDPLPEYMKGQFR